MDEVQGIQFVNYTPAVMIGSNTVSASTPQAPAPAAALRQRAADMRDEMESELRMLNNMREGVKARERKIAVLQRAADEYEAAADKLDGK